MLKIAQSRDALMKYERKIVVNLCDCVDDGMTADRKRGADA